MKNVKAIKNISLILNAYIFISSMVILFLGLNGLSGSGFLSGASFDFLRFYTNLSNVFAAFTSAAAFIYIIENYKEPDLVVTKALKFSMFIALCSLMLTMLTTIFFLGPYVVIMGGNFFQLFQGYLLFFHLINPVVFFVIYNFFIKGPKFNYKDCLFLLIPTGIYSALYNTMVFTHVWDDFYGFTFGGNVFAPLFMVPTSILSIYLIALLFNFINNKIQRL